MAIDITKLSDEELEKKINSAKVAIERNTGLIKEASEKKLKKLEAELESRAKGIKKEVKEDVEATEKAAKKVAKKVEKEVEDIVEKPKSKRGRPKGSTKKAATKKSAPKKETKTAAKAKKSEPTDKFELTIDGKVYKFADLKSKQECEKAMNAVKSRYKEVKEHKEATKEGIKKAATIPVTKRISDSFASIAKKAVSEVPKTKITQKPTEIKKEIDELEKAFENLFDKLESLMGKKIPSTQRKQVVSILTKFEDKVEKGTDKKSSATSKVRKEEGGFASSDVGTEIIADASSDGWGADNPFSYASLM